MRLQIIHLSDIHFEKKEQTFEIQIDKMIQAINSVDNADECIIVISGDLAAKGKKNQYSYVSSLLGAILKKIGTTNYRGKTIQFVCVPGNHDIDFGDLEVSFKDIVDAYEKGKIDELVRKYLNSMSDFYNFAKHRGCFRDNDVVSKKVITYGEKKIGFVMLNTAPLSLLNGNYEDMGSHYVSEEQLRKIEHATEAEINVLVMHHSIEWFKGSCKDKLRSIISKKYSLVLTGHEHSPIGESRNINGLGEIQYMQGNALLGYAEAGNGFCTINIDIEKGNMIGHSYLWDGDIYIPKKNLNSRIKQYLCGGLAVRKEFLYEISIDNYKRNVDDYYVFPSLSYSIFNEKEEMERHDIEVEKEFFELIDDYDKIVITGEHKAGKTILAKQLFRKFLSMGKNPLLITASDINKKKIERTVEYTFKEQYEEEGHAYEKFKQLDLSDKIVLLDEANLISEKILNSLLSFLEENFGKVIVFSEENISLDIKKQVMNVMTESDTVHLTIKPFLYVKRKKLISNILNNDMERGCDIEKETKKINELINMQIKFFNLNPEFIINFVNKYENDYRFEFSAGMNVFNIVYESSIRNRIIANAEEIDATIVINILRDLAYYMHFSKKNVVGINEVSHVIEEYEKTYRQKVKVMAFINVALKAKVLVENTNEIRFKDHTLVAYFVAQALNQKYNQEEDIQANLEYLLKNLCFSINSDIILFLALITNNPKFVNIIVNGAKEHFGQQEELSFDKGNISFLMDTLIPVKDTVPDKQEVQRREAALAKQEEEIKLTDIVELVNEYDYCEEDLKKIENQIMISFKYIEILSKTLPAFCQNMKAEQQDRIVSLVYRCPNQFLFMLLKDIEKNFDDFCSRMYEEIIALRKEKNETEVSLQKVKNLIEQISALFVMVMYQMIAATCTTEQSIVALNEFDYNSNSNYKLQNLMMLSRYGEIISFSRRAQQLDDELDGTLEKSIIKYTVREYFIRNNVELYGAGQSLLDHFFSGETGRKLKMEIAKKRIIEKDHI